MHLTAVLLAAGQSKRMGCSKQLLPLSDKPVIRWCLDGLLAGGVNDIVVVLGPTGREIEELISGYELIVAWNLDPESDMAGSLRVGLKALPDKTDSVLVLPVDHPMVSPQTIAALAEAHRIDPGLTIIPAHNGQNGHPVIFPLHTVEELFSLPTLRDVVHRDSTRVRQLEVDDGGVLLNLNTPEDLRRAEAWSRLMLKHT